MIQVSIDLGKLTDWIGLIVNTLGLTSGLVMLWFTRRTVQALLSQLRSQSSHQIVEAHKSLYMPIVSNPDLSRIVSGGEPTKFQQRMLGSMMINHAGRIFAEFKHKIRSPGDMARFQTDMRDMFTLGLVASRWPEVKTFHDADFMAFVDAALAEPPSAVPALGEPPLAPEFIRKPKATRSRSGES